MRVLLFLMSTVFLLVSCQSTTESSWGYVGDKGPDNWAKIEPEFKLCGQGTQQSPINIRLDKLVKLAGKDFSLSYLTAANEIVNNGHSIQINIKDGSFLTINGFKYSLKQFHVHTPSENMIDDKSYPMEAHFVHISKEGKIAVIAVIFDIAENKNVIIDKILSSSPQLGNKEDFNLTKEEILALIPNTKRYYHFKGSLTTPPCTEGVEWFVLEAKKHITKEQKKHLMTILRHKNNRPVQKINKRVVEYIN